MKHMLGFPNHLRNLPKRLYDSIADQAFRCQSNLGKFYVSIQPDKEERKIEEFWVVLETDFSEIDQKCRKKLAKREFIRKLFLYGGIGMTPFTR